MLIISIIAIVLALFLLAVKRYCKAPDINDVKDLVANSNISSLHVSSKLFGITELVFTKKLILESSIEPQKIIKKIVEIKSETVGTFTWERNKNSIIKRLQLKNSKSKSYIKFKIKLSKHKPIGHKVKKGKVIANIITLNIPMELVAPIDGTIVGVEIMDDSPVEYGQLLILIEEL